MKRILLLSAAVLTVISLNYSQAQGVKIGYINVDAVVSYMPELSTVQTELKEYEGQLGSQLQTKYQTIQTKSAEYQKLEAGLTEVVKAEKQKEILDLQTNFQKFQADAQQAVARKEVELLNPLYTKVQAAIDAVAKANGYSHIFRSETMLYSAQGEDISKLVLGHLNIELPKEEPATEGGN